jgi:hypothetical protein
MHTKFWSENMKERDLEELNIDGKIILKWNLRKYGVRMWTGFSWLWIGTRGGIL